MGRHRRIDMKIHPLVWNSPGFQALWAARWATPAKVMRMRPCPFVPPADRREMETLTVRNRFNKIKRKLYPLIVERFGESCLQCGSAGPLFLDHVIPICWGGTNDEANFQPLCGPCNGLKHGRLPTPPEATNA